MPDKGLMPAKQVPPMPPAGTHGRTHAPLPWPCSCVTAGRALHGAPYTRDGRTN